MSAVAAAAPAVLKGSAVDLKQGLTLAHFAAQRKHRLLCMVGNCRVIVTETAQVELRSGRV